MIKFIKDWMLVIAMLAGGLSYKYTGHLSFLIPYLIFVMLLISFSKLSPRGIKFGRLHLILLSIQLPGSLIAYAIFQFFDPILAQGALICIMICTATSAVVITSMLGGDLAFLTTYTLISSLGLAIFAPLVFAYVSTNDQMPFIDSFLMICRQVGMLLVLPLIVAWVVRLLAPRINIAITKASWLSFYIWALALAIVTGNTIRFFVEQQNPNYTIELLLALLSILICVGQFVLGRYLGRKYNDDPISAGQGLGQKNTVLAIWMSQIYLNPVVSVAPATYVLWQNLINAYQLWRKRSSDGQK